MLNYRKASIATLAASAILSAQPVVPAGGDVSALTDSRKEDFLRNAKVTLKRDIGIGINNTTRVTLEDVR